MTCASCGEKKCNCKQDSCSAPAVLEIVNKPEIVTFHKVIIPASVGDETTKPPVPGLYRNTLLVYEASNEAYLYSSDCIPTKITDKAELKRLETLLGNEVAERKEADAYLEEKIDNIKGLKYEIVETLPETGEAGIIYLVPKTSEAPDFYDEYLWINNAFEKIGSTEVKLDDYVLKDEIFNRYTISTGAKVTDGVKLSPYAVSPASASNGGVAIGSNARANTSVSLAVGHSASSTNGGYEAIGSSSTSTTSGRAYAGATAETSGVAFGPGTRAIETGLAIGINATASSGGMTFGGTATNSGRSVFGTANGGGSLAIGGTASNDRNYVGTSINGNATGGLAIVGTANGANSVAIGYDSSCTEYGVEAIGNGSIAKGGSRAYAGGKATESGLAFGMSATSEQGGFEAIGRNSYATSGGRAYAGGKSYNGSIAIGGTAVGGGSLTFGGNATTGVNGVAGIAIGANSVSSESAAVAIGSGAGAHGMSSVAIGSSSSATEAATVSFGGTNTKRRLVNIAPGRDDNDAVAMSQLNALSDKVDGISMAKAPNVTLIGEPTLNNGQASDFSTENYLQFPFILDLTGKTFVIDFCFTTGNDVAVQQNIIDSDFGVALAISGGKGLMAISSNGTGWNIGTAVGTFAIEANTTYFARLSWDGSVYKTALSTDGVTYTDDMSITSSVAPFPTTHYIGGAGEGVSHNPHYFRGVIDLNKSKMTINDELFWEGMDSLGLRTRADISLSNLDAAGEAKIRLAASADIVQTTPTIVGKYNGKNVYRYSVSLAGKRVSGSSMTTVGTIPNALDPGNNCTIVAFSGRITSDQGSARYFYPLPYVGAGSGSFMLISPFVDMNESSMTANIQLGIYPSISSVTGLNGDYLTVDYTLD